MYNKIASIILNSAKADGLSEVFVAQPDSLKENLAGKIFVLAEISGKKIIGKKIFNFLISALNDDYYNDEKILFRDKIEGLKIENIFEAALAKINKKLANFLTKEKIKINPAATNISLGVIYENNLYFSSFGRNRALLLYPHNEEYEIINVETNATEIPFKPAKSDSVEIQAPKLFSSVISGEVPLNSYFVFTSESLPEYLSANEMIRIITKLPPITAAGQIKNVLSKINNYVPFLGIIIKNTTGLSNQKISEEPKDISSTTRDSISSLNYTEAKTEQMLTPAGLINLSKFFKTFKKLFNNCLSILASLNKKSSKIRNKTDNQTTTSTLNIGKVKSLNLARSDSFLIKEKIFFKKKSSWISIKAHKIVLTASAIFNLKTWLGLSGYLKSWAKGLNTKNRWLFIALGAVVVILITSLFLTSWNRQRQLAQTNFNNLVANIQTQENSIDAHLLYHDEIGAKQIFIKTQALLNSLPQITKNQKTVYQVLAAKLKANQDKIEKIVNIKTATEVNDLGILGINNLVYAQGKIYGASGSTIYSLTPGNPTYTKIKLAGTSNLSNPVFYGSNLYYWNNNQIIRYNIKTGHNKLFNIADLNSGDKITSFKIFYGNLYLLVKNKNQIYRYLANSKGFKTKTDWLQEKVDLSKTSDLFIDGNIYILKNSGQVLKFFKGRLADYYSVPLSPVMVNANKLIVGNKNIYIFEASSKRLAVLAKSNGHLLNQYRLNFLQAPQDFTIDEANKTAYFLVGAKIYKIKLKQ